MYIQNNIFKLYIDRYFEKKMIKDELNNLLKGL